MLLSAWCVGVWQSKKLECNDYSRWECLIAVKEENSLAECWICKCCVVVFFQHYVLYILYIYTTFTTKHCWKLALLAVDISEDSRVFNLLVPSMYFFNSFETSDLHSVGPEWKQTCKTPTWIQYPCLLKKRSPVWRGPKHSHTQSKHTWGWLGLIQNVVDPNRL